MIGSISGFTVNFLSNRTLIDVHPVRSSKDEVVALYLASINLPVNPGCRAAISGTKRLHSE